ncbi:MAG: hypothetical protein ACREL5_09875 [Gemmatimonadales bacterium]
MSSRSICLAVVVIAAVHSAAAQDTTRIRLGVSGVSAAQPGMVVLAGPGLDSVRTIVQRDLELSDRFSVALLSDTAGTLTGPFDVSRLKSTGLTWAVELEPAIGGVDIKLYDVTTGALRQQASRALDPGGAGDSRITIHRVSDQIVTWTGGVGIAATRIVFKERRGNADAIWRIDSDGANAVQISHGGITGTPAWSPDGASVSYAEASDGRWTLYVQRLSTGTRAAVPSSSPGDNYGPSFSPDGRSLAFVHGAAGGSVIETADVARMCCAHALTHDGKLADNVSPAYSPDGRHIAYVSTRTGTTQIWMMDNDGTSGGQFVPSGFDPDGRPLPTYSPAWSPDGTRMAFARDTRSGGRQIYVVSIGSGQIAQLTADGRNEDPSWAPDSRHLVFKSTRSGKEQLWILDVESSAARQIATPGTAQYPAWSRTLGTNP